MTLLRTQVGLWTLALVFTSSTWGQEFQIPQPGPEHKVLEKMVGTWEATIQTEGAPEMTGTMVYKFDYNGFWLIGNFSGEFMGQKFTGRDTTGYDPIKKKYVGTWIDSMSPTMMVSTAEYDKEKKTFTSVGTGPSMDQQAMAEYRTVTEFKSDNEMVMTMYMKEKGGEESKTMTIVYKRKK